MIVNSNNAKLRQIFAKQGRVAQQKAYDNPECYNEETEELFAWWQNEIVMRDRGDEIMPIITDGSGNGHLNQ